MLFEHLGEVARNVTRAADAQESVPLAKAFAVDRKVILQVSDVLPQTLEARLQPVLGAVCVENPRSLFSLENPRFGRIRCYQVRLIPCTDRSFGIWEQSSDLSDGDAPELINIERDPVGPIVWATWFGHRATSWRHGAMVGIKIQIVLLSFRRRRATVSRRQPYVRVSSTHRCGLVTY
jgi:hypothetical protein